MEQGKDNFEKECKTGDICPKSGLWYCKIHPAVEESIRKGAEFPDCYHVVGHRTTWVYVENN